MYRANWWQLWADLLGMLFIGGLVAPALVNAANDYAKSIGADTIINTGIGWMATLGAGMFLQSTDDFNAFKSVFGRGAQWTPFSLVSGWRLTEGVFRMVTGEVDPFDTVVKQMAFARNTEPVFNYVKLKTLGVPVGQNYWDELTA